MPILEITNNNTSVYTVHNPENTSEYITTQPATTSSTTISADFALYLEDIIASKAAEVNDAGAPLYVFDFKSDPTDSLAEIEANPGTSAAHHAANKVNYGHAVSNPSTPSTVDTIALDHAAGEVFVDGQFEAIVAGIDVNPTVLTKAGVAAGSLVVSEDVYGHVVYYNDSSNIQMAMILGDAVANGEAVTPLAASQIASALAEFTSATSPVHAYVLIADVLFEHDGSSLSQTTTSIRTVPSSY